jgi:predicted DNA-binding transcriptional regulator AlpA
VTGHPARAPLRIVPVVDRVSADVHLDPYLTLRGLADYSKIAPSTLRAYLRDPEHPLPAYQLGGRLLFRVSEVDAWIARRRYRPRVDVDAIVANVLGPKRA